MLLAVVIDIARPPAQSTAILGAGHRDNVVVLVAHLLVPKRKHAGLLALGYRWREHPRPPVRVAQHTAAQMGEHEIVAADESFPTVTPNDL